MANFLNVITAPFQQSTPDLIDLTDILENLPGKTVTVYTEAYGWQLGTVQFICPSPYYGDDRITAYVVNLDGQPGWSEYVDVTEVI